MNNKKQKYTFHVHGMHCEACVLLTESEIGELPNVISVKTSLVNHTVEVEGDFGEKTEEQIARELTIPLEAHGYTVSVDKQTKEKKWADFKIAVPVAIAFIFLFVLLQKMGIVNFIEVNDVSFGTAFLIGVIASLSSCMAVVGGLVLSMSATFSKEGDRVKPQLLFHFGRIISFFILGGVIGMIGSAFTLNITGTFVLGLLVGIVMLILGLNLLDIFHFTKKFQFSMPRFLAKRALDVHKINHSLTPLLVGVATFFLPCGFTQSMQVYTLSSGSFLKGGLTMLFFALGTFPVLAILSFGSSKISKTSQSGIFFKTAGLIVVAFAIINILNALVVVGLIKPFLNF